MLVDIINKAEHLTKGRRSGMNAQYAARWAAQFVVDKYPFIEAKAEESGRSVVDVVKSGLIAMIRTEEVDEVDTANAESVNGVVFDRTAQAVLIDEERVDLTASQTIILLILLANVGQEVTSDILAQVTGSSQEALRNDIDSLRRKVGARRVVTVRGVGYIMPHSHATRVEFDHERGDVTIGDRTANVKPIQMRILCSLAEANGKAISDEEMMRRSGVNKIQRLRTEIYGLRRLFGPCIILREGKGYALGWSSKYTTRRKVVSSDPDSNELTVDGRTVQLPAMQFQIVELLLAQPGKCVLYEDLMRVTGIKEKYYLRIRISQINGALGGLVRITNVRERGYKLDV